MRITIENEKNYQIFTMFVGYKNCFLFLKKYTKTCLKICFCTSNNVSKFKCCTRTGSTAPIRKFIPANPKEKKISPDQTQHFPNAPAHPLN